MMEWRAGPGNISAQTLLRLLAEGSLGIRLKASQAIPGTDDHQVLRLDSLLLDSESSDS